MGLFGGSSPTDTATETTTATLDPSGVLAFSPAAPDWLLDAPYVAFEHFGDGLFGIEPTSAGTDEVVPLGPVEGVTSLDAVTGEVACPVASALRDGYDLDPTTLPRAVELRVAYDPGARRVLLDVGELTDALVAGIESGDRTISTCPWC